MAASTSGPVERCEGEHGAAAHRRLVAAGDEDGAQAAGVTDGAERGDRGFATQRLGVVGRHDDERGDGSSSRGLSVAHSPSAHAAASATRCSSSSSSASNASPTASRASGGGGERGGAAAHVRVGVLQGSSQLVGVEDPAAGEGGEGRGPYGRVWIGEKRPRR